MLFHPASGGRSAFGISAALAGPNDILARIGAGIGTAELKLMCESDVGASWVKIFGERNTGTNALAEVIRTNSETQCIPGTEREVDLKAWRRAHRRWIIGDRMREWCFDRIFSGQDALHSWKHCATNFDDVAVFGGVLVLIAVRHPASWLVSLHRNPYQSFRSVPASIAEFIDFKWHTNRRERLQRAVFTPLELYEAKMASYARFTDSLSKMNIAHRYVRFEDLIMQQEGEFRRLSECLSRPRADFQPLLRSTKSDRLFSNPVVKRTDAREPAVSKNLDFYRDYYGEERWRESLEGLEAEINGRIDWDLLRPFEYRPL